jgi:hypothetical protein
VAGALGAPGLIPDAETLPPIRSDKVAAAAPSASVTSGIDVRFVWSIRSA